MGEQTYVAFHALNAWEEKVDVDGQTNTVVKVITCDFFELDLDQNELSKDLSPGRSTTPERARHPYRYSHEKHSSFNSFTRVHLPVYDVVISYHT